MKKRFFTPIIDWIIPFLLMCLFGWVALGNVLHFKAYNSKMHLQVFTPEMADLLSYIVPSLLVTAFALLFIPNTRKTGLLFSTVLLFIFSLYIFLVVMGTFGEVPCSCISVFEGMGWVAQFIFTLFFFLLAFIGLTFKRKEAW